MFPFTVRVLAPTYVCEYCISSILIATDRAADPGRLLRSWGGVLPICRLPRLRRAGLHPLSIGIAGTGRSNAITLASPVMVVAAVSIGKIATDSRNMSASAGLDRGANLLFVLFTYIGAKMPTRNHLQIVARNLKRQLNGRAFLTLERTDVTQELRDVSGEDTTRIKSGIAEGLEQALLEQGVRCFPGLRETTTGDTIRLFHAGTVLSNLVDLLIYPSTDTDRDLGNMIKKIKGEWNWSTPTGPAAVVDQVEATAGRE